MEVRDKDLAGRIGRLKTKKGIIETPYLFPVIDPVRQELSVNEIKKMGFNAVITNAYLAYKRGWKKDIHLLLDDNNLIIMTDSGAYQLLEYGEVELSNKEIIEIEKTLNSDIAVILDIPTGDSLDKEYAEYTVKETLKRAKEAKELIDQDKRLWVLPIQGGVHLDLVEYSTKKSIELDYDIYALGSPTRIMERYNYSILLDMIKSVRKHLPMDQPLHLFGAGHPMMIPFAVAMGADLFDSASYILFARDNRYMTDSGTIRLEELDYIPCNCPICSKYTPKELLEMNKTERTRLLATHNLYMIKTMIEKTKQAIKEGRLWELLEEQSRKHPRLYTAMKKIAENSKWLEKYTPRTKSKVKALLLYDEVSGQNPKILRLKKYIEEKYQPPPFYNKAVIKIKTPTSAGYNVTENGQVHIIYYAPIIGIIPSELIYLYPMGQNIFPETPNRNVQKNLAKDIIEYLDKTNQFYDKITLEICKDLPTFSTEVKKKLNKKPYLDKIILKEKNCNKQLIV